MASNPKSQQSTDLDREEHAKADAVGMAWQELCKSNSESPPETTVTRLHSLAAACIEMAVFLEMQRLGRTPTFVVHNHKVED